MTVFAGILLTLAAFAFITYPLFRQRLWPSDSAPEDDQTQELLSRRDTAYSMLKELEFDHQSGILNQEDYQELETRYKKKAVAILKDIDQAGKGSEPAEPDIEDEIERQVQQRRQSRGRFCTQCGAKHQEADRFCPGCGARL